MEMGKHDKIASGSTSEKNEKKMKKEKKNADKDKKESSRKKDRDDHEDDVGTNPTRHSTADKQVTGNEQKREKRSRHALVERVESRLPKKRRSTSPVVDNTSIVEASTTKTVSVAVPGSIVSNALTPELRAYVIMFISAVFG